MVQTQPTPEADEAFQTDEHLGRTEWEDALIKHGIVNKPQKQITEDEVQLLAQEFCQKIDPLEQKNMEELDELEDDIEEDEMRKYRAKRIAELKAKASREKYGTVIELNHKDDFVTEVTEASEEEGLFVVCHLYVFSKDECILLNRHLDNLAKRFPAVKFVKIKSTECIANYPDKRCPTLLIYHKGDIHRQIIGLSSFGGPKTTEQTLEWGLAGIGVLKTELEENPLTKSRMQIKRHVKSRGKDDGADDESISDVDSDEELFGDS